ncbi:Prospero homeobox protein 1 [Bagarius yarrelli]|uniref:Prospero homeobox protein 1 n=1 Tax=Bagarius yarrelli TaxID=175774 RepID=A0A556U524_BAGYA|nr:Prospero homeobox protein 1 [Bagarius yarrelli]
MNLRPSDQSNYKPNKVCLEDTKADLMLSCLRRDMYEEHLSSYHNAPLISHLLRKNIQNKRPVLNNHQLYMPATSTAASSVAESRPTLTETPQDDWSNPSFNDSQLESASPDYPLSEHVQAKRARVENIIRGMASSPSDSSHADRDRESTESEVSRYSREVHKENKRKQKLPQHQEHNHDGIVAPNRETNLGRDEECHKLRKQLQSMQHLLHQLQEKFLQMYDHSSSESEERQDNHEIGMMNIDAENNELEHKDSLRLDQKNLQEMLKCELSRAITESVDMVFSKLSAILDNQSPQPECTSMDKQEHQACAKESSDLETATKPRSAECYKSITSPSPEHQTEALSLVVRKPPLNPLGSVSHSIKRPYPLQQSPFQFSHSSPLHDSQILEHLLKYGPHANFSGIACLPPSLDRSSTDSVALPWETIAMRSKFNRCITSQLIKWFSNFREFYYIQMEKFARQAIVDGVSEVKDISVSRDSEVFRALNMHYNKANDFQVPERFLEVAEITLHEFYNAISLSKDSDPSWKKAIYKIICKLDSEVPDEFKSPTPDIKGMLKRKEMALSECNGLMGDVLPTRGKVRDCQSRKKEDQAALVAVDCVLWRVLLTPANTPLFLSSSHSHLVTLKLGCHRGSGFAIKISLRF